VRDAAVSRQWKGAIFFPDCTYLTRAAGWAFKDGPYHQKVKPGTLVGEARRKARDDAVAFVRFLSGLPIEYIAIENPRGFLTTMHRPPDQVIHPHEFGDDASKATCLWLKGLPRLIATKNIPPRMVNGMPRWANQTDSGQNRLSPGPNRARDRSETYPGIADAMAVQWTDYVAERIAA